MPALPDEAAGGLSRGENLGSLIRAGIVPGLLDAVGSELAMWSTPAGVLSLPGACPPFFPLRHASPNL